MNSSVFYQALRLAAMFTALVTFAFCAADEHHPPHWTYEHPEQWGKLDPAYSSCSSGRTQSPIDVKNAKPSDLAALKIDYQDVPLNIIDNGHTIQVNYAPGSSLSVGDKTYALKQFHFHHPAEEHINGRSFPLVAHFVHADAEGHLAVIAVLFETGTTNPLIDTLWQNLPSEKEAAKDVPSVTVRARELLPAGRGYFTFAGSPRFILGTPVPFNRPTVARFCGRNDLLLRRWSEASPCSRNPLIRLCRETEAQTDQPMP